MDMTSLSISQFRRECLKLLERLPADGVTVTKRGRPIARVAPIRKDDSALIGCLAGEFEIRGDILSTGERWDAES